MQEPILSDKGNLHLEKICIFEIKYKNACCIQKDTNDLILIFSKATVTFGDLHTCTIGINRASDCLVPSLFGNTLRTEVTPKPSYLTPRI